LVYQPEAEEVAEEVAEGEEVEVVAEEEVRANHPRH
jgi:hypothetical protein